MLKVAVYALVEPDTGAIRYVGITKNPLADRLRRHVAEATGDRGKTYKGRWIKSLLDRGLEPAIEQLDLVDEDDWQQAERDWIAYLRDDLGLRLTNGCDGGRGVINPSPEVRAIYSETAKRTFTGRPKPWRGQHKDLSDETREKMRTSALNRKPVDDETRVRISAAATLKWERKRARGGAPCDCRRCVMRRTSPRTIAAQEAKAAQPKLPKKSNHTRYHVNRGVVKDGCFYCVQQPNDLVT